MTKSTITREESVQAVFDLKVGYRLGFADIEILKRVARMALAAMDSEPVEMPLDYLQGHKDGLEWASQLAEANHPETGDWLYDDPIELAKAIRKGPDMPPEQPVADSEPDRNPVLAYADSYRDMAKQGVKSVPIWSVITDIERNIAPLYRHAQPAKTVHPVMFIDGDISSEDADKLAKVIRELHEKDERPLAKMARIIRENPRQTNECDMPKAQPVPVGQDDVSIFEAAIEECKTCDSIDEHAWNHGVLAVIAKYEACRAAMLAAAKQSPGSEPVTVPGKWIPVSERMPDCWCRTCRPVTLNDMRFVGCPDCGNKRCPRANDHGNACTGSNDPGQEGSAYQDTPREQKP